MAQPIPDLWPEIEQSQVVPPVAILRGQAALLGKKTNHLLEGRVVSTSTGYGFFVHSFYIVAPALDDYTYKLFEISHGADPYPVLVPGLPHRGALGYGVPVEAPQLASEQELLDYIRKILNSDETKRVIGSLLAQIKATS
jgi:hypothetical protein